VNIGKPEAEVWRALFPTRPGSTGYGYDRSEIGAIYPVTAMDDLSNLYRRLAVLAQDQLPTVTQILADPVWGALVDTVAENDRRFTDQKNGLRDPKRQFDFFSDGGYNDTQSLARNLGLFELFHTPPSTPLVDSYNVPPDDPRSRAKWRGYKRTTLPKPDDFRDEIDFLVAPRASITLLRKLGLVVHPLLTAMLGCAECIALRRSDPADDNEGWHLHDTSPRTRTRYDANHFQALPRPTSGPGDYRILDGLLDLDPKQFNLIQADPDGAVLKVMNFARTLSHLKQSPDKAGSTVNRNANGARNPNAAMRCIITRRNVEEQHDTPEKI
jgi:hypothetical protein